MPSNITQEQLEICRLGMVIARLQMKALQATLAGFQMNETIDKFKALDYQFDELSKQIHNGEIVGYDDLLARS